MLTFFTKLTLLVTILGACGQPFGGSNDNGSDTKDFEPMHPSFMQSGNSATAIPIANIAELVQKTNVSTFHNQGHYGEGVKVAILDNGFAGVQASIGKTLPATTLYFPGPKNPPQQTDHGTKMAELVQALATGSATVQPNKQGPELLLFNTNGFTNFKSAVRTAIKKKVDIIVYSQVWAYGGNFDGKGFINEIVNEATNAGILWLNAAGNAGLSTYQAKLEYLRGDKAVHLPYQKRYLRFTVPADNTPTKIILSWNDFQESSEYKTDQDLDLFLETEDGRPLASGQRKQTGAQGKKDKNFSSHAREIIAANLRKGTYHLRIDMKSHNFKADSFYRVTIDGYGIRMKNDPLPEKSMDYGVLIPADNPQVIAVGSNDVDYTLTGGMMSKPDVVAPSRIILADGRKYHGSSASTGILGGVIAALKSFKPQITKAQVIRTMNEFIENPHTKSPIRTVANPSFIPPYPSAPYTTGGSAPTWYQQYGIDPNHQSQRGNP